MREVPEAELPPFWLVGDPFPEAELPPFPVDDIPLSVESLPEEELPVLPLVDCPLERSIPLPVVPGRETVWAMGVKLVAVIPPAVELPDEPLPDMEVEDPDELPVPEDPEDPPPDVEVAAVIVHVPETADTESTLVWVVGAEEMVPETVGVTV